MHQQQSAKKNCLDVGFNNQRRKTYLNYLLVKPDQEGLRDLKMAELQNVNAVELPSGQIMHYIRRYFYVILFCSNIFCHTPKNKIKIE